MQYIVEQQQQALKSSKMATYQMIPRWMPYSTPLYIEQISAVFSHLKDCQNDAAEEDAASEVNLDILM